MRRRPRRGQPPSRRAARPAQQPALSQFLLASLPPHCECSLSHSHERVTSLPAFVSRQSSPSLLSFAAMRKYSLLLAIALAALAGGCARMPTGVTPLKAKTGSDLRKQILESKADVDQFR